MIGLFKLSWMGAIFITFILGICVLAQTISIILMFYEKEKKLGQALKIFLEISILLELLLFSLLYGEIANGYRSGIVFSTGYSKSRIALFLIILILVLALNILNRRLSSAETLVLGLILVPGIENIMGRAFPWIFILVLLALLIRSIINSRQSLLAIRTGITALSVVNAIDTLPTGVLFCESDGYTILCNFQMQELIYLITGKVFRNSLEIYKLLISGEYKSNYKRIQLEGQSIYILPDYSAWIFKKTDIRIKRKNYLHISATNVSKNWEFTCKLQEQEAELEKKSQELKDTISNLQILSKEKEINKYKMKAHDILGQRLSILLRMIQDKDKLDYELLKNLSKGLLEELKSEDRETSPLEDLEKIQEVFSFIGVKIEFTGELPKDQVQGELILDIIREAATNAVRHGFAREINIEAKQTNDLYNLLIKNTGYTTRKEIVPGSGIKIMENKINENNGKLEIISYPDFILSVSIPGVDENV